MGIAQLIILDLVTRFIGSQIVNRQMQGFLTRYRSEHHRCPRRWISLRFVRSIGRLWAEHLQHDRCCRGLTGRASHLQCGSGTPDRIAAVPRRSSVDGLTSAAAVLRHMRRHCHRALAEAPDGGWLTAMFPAATHSR